MIYNSFTIGYKNVTGGAYVGAYVSIANPNANVVFGNIQCRPMTGAAGVFTNEAFQRIDIRIKRATDATLDALKKGAFLKLKLDNGAIVTEMEFVVSAVDVIREGADLYNVISLTPALVGLDGNEAKVAYSLHA